LDHPAPAPNQGEKKKGKEGKGGGTIKLRTERYNA